MERFLASPASSASCALPACCLSNIIADKVLVPFAAILGPAEVLANGDELHFGDDALPRVHRAG